MADLVITAANVIAGGGATYGEDLAGVALTAGQLVYREAATGLLKLADANSATAEARSVYGLTLNGAAIGQPVRVQRAGLVTVGAAVVTGTAYYLSNTAGMICPEADLTSGSYPVLIGFANSASLISLKIAEAGVAKP